MNGRMQMEWIKLSKFTLCINISRVRLVTVKKKFVSVIFLRFCSVLLRARSVVSVLFRATFAICAWNIFWIVLSHVSWAIFPLSAMSHCFLCSNAMRKKTGAQLAHVARNRTSYMAQKNKKKKRAHWEKKYVKVRLMTALGLLFW